MSEPTSQDMNPAHPMPEGVAAAEQEAVLPPPQPLPVLPGVMGLFQAHAENRLEAPLQAQELEPSMVEQVQSYAVAVAARHKMGPGVAWMGVSQDGQRVGMRDTVGVAWDFGISEALSASAHDHLNEAMALVQGKAPGAPTMAQQATHAAPAMQASAPGGSGGEVASG